jgi:hypothetical protein
VTTVGGGGGGQGLATRDWHTGGTGGAYGTGAGAHTKDNCIGNFTRADFTGAIGASGSLPAHNVHKGGDSYCECEAVTPTCGGGGGAGGNGTGPDLGLPWRGESGSPPSVGNGGVGVYVAAFNTRVGGGGAGTSRSDPGTASDGGGQYIDGDPYRQVTPNAVDGTGGGGGGSRRHHYGGLGGSGVIMFRYRIGDETTRSPIEAGNMCNACPSGTYFEPVHAICISCPVNTTSVALSTSIANCTCLSGYTGSGAEACGGPDHEMSIRSNISSTDVV